jgi:hypothetical protein
MGLLDWFFGRKEELRTQQAATTYGPGGGVQQLSETDEQVADSAGDDFGDFGRDFGDGDFGGGF